MKLTEDRYRNTQGLKLKIIGQKTNLLLQYTLDLRKPDLRKNLDLRKIVATTDFFST